MDKVCVKEDDCDTSIREYFRKLREDQRLFDVTLATDDGKQIQAHRAILCAGSNFFSDILLRSNYTNVIVYLKGIISAQLECVLAFLYNGEAFIPQMELEQFLETGKELEVKGLLRLGVPGDNEHNDQISGIDDMVVNQEGSLNNTHVKQWGKSKLFKDMLKDIWKVFFIPAKCAVKHFPIDPIFKHISMEFIQNYSLVILVESQA